MTDDDQTVPRRHLDGFWQQLDDMAPRPPWGVLASATDVNNVLLSFIYYVRHNDVLLMTLDAATWRHLDNHIGGRLFSFLVGNADVFGTKPKAYLRLFLHGRLETFGQDDTEYKRMYSIYERGNNIDPKSVTHIGVLTPERIEYGIKGGAKYHPEEISINLARGGFDADYHYTG